VLESLETPTHVITSRDDPMILARDLDRLARSSAFRLTVTQHGGHCGYMDAVRGPSWIDRLLVSELARD
jgi:predicted alpha/beta-fold hydrolase